MGKYVFKKFYAIYRVNEVELHKQLDSIINYTLTETYQGYFESEEEALNHLNNIGVNYLNPMPLYMIAPIVVPVVEIC